MKSFNIKHQFVFIANEALRLTNNWCR